MFVSKMWEAIEDLIQASLKTAQYQRRRSQRVIAAILGTKVLARQVQECHSGSRFQQVVDRDMVDPG